MDSIKFIFTNEIEVCFFLSYRFIDNKGNLIPLDELKKFRDKIKRDTPKLVRDKEIEFDNRKTHYSFFNSFCTEKNMPLVISIDPNKVNIEQDAHIMNGEVTESNISPRDMQIRLSQYGAATIRLLFKLSTNEAEAFDENFLNLILKNLKNQAGRYARAAWQNFCEIWNGISEYKIFEVKQIDIYLILLPSGIRIGYDNQEIMLADLKRSKVNIQQDIRKNIEKVLVGLAISSYLWPKYSEDFIQKFIRSDLSTTEDEFQFIAWRNALIYFEGEETELPGRYRDYLYDMLLGLELLFLIRSSLQLLDIIIDKKISQGLIRSEIKPVKLVKFKDYRNILEYFDRWLLLLTGWRKINRYAIASHFHDFLMFGLQAMRIESWLTTIENKISLLRDTVKALYDMLSNINLFVLSLILVALTIFLIFK